MAPSGYKFDSTARTYKGKTGNKEKKKHLACWQLCPSRGSQNVTAILSKFTFPALTSLISSLPLLSLTHFLFPPPVVLRWEVRSADLLKKWINGCLVCLLTTDGCSMIFLKCFESSLCLHVNRILFLVFHLFFRYF